MGAEPEADYLTPGELARLYGVAAKTIKRWADQGKLPPPALRVGRRGDRLWRREEVLAALGAPPATPQPPT